MLAKFQFHFVPVELTKNFASIKPPKWSRVNAIPIRVTFLLGARPKGTMSPPVFLPPRQSPATPTGLHDI